MNDLFEKLAAPFPADQVHWRVGATKGNRGMVLAYIDARNVMDRLDSVVTPESWSDNYEETASGRVICRLSVYFPQSEEWVTKSDGAGSTGTEGEKGAISDAFKRAAVKWGIGRYLYSIDSPWIELDQGKYIPRDFDGSKYLNVPKQAEQTPFMTLYQAVFEIKRDITGEDMDAAMKAWRFLNNDDKAMLWHSDIFSEDERDKITKAAK